MRKVSSCKESSIFLICFHYFKIGFFLTRQELKNKGNNCDLLVEFCRFQRGGGEEEYNNGNKKKKRRRIPKYRARRWVVERTHSWMNRFRRLLIRWEKKEDNYTQ